MKKIALLVLLLMATQLFATMPNTELRATWLTTVWGIDWPKTQITGSSESQRTTQRNAQKRELCTILDSLKAAGMNAVFFQIRGMSDAMYNSPYEKWCQYLTGTRGEDPGYDPLAYAIEEAHARGLELHAWLNPYRYSSSDATFSNLSGDYAKAHPTWLMKYSGGVSILNPGMPEVRARIKTIIGDIINRYEVDGIVFDDYFYAYGGTDATLDKTAQNQYKPVSQNLGDWRRENVNKMVADVYDTIQQVKPYIKFGISPFGTWTTDKSVAAAHDITLPSGVGTTGNMYAEIYCDPIAWLEEGTVDYVSPQIYWTSGSPYPYGKLADWWSGIANRFGRHFYSSHSVSALTAASSAVSNGAKMIQVSEYEMVESRALSGVERAVAASNFTQSEIGVQVGFNRTYDLNDAPGSVFYNTNKTINTRGFVKYLRENIFKQRCHTPHINWKSSDIPQSPSGLTLNAKSISWTTESNSNNARTIIYLIPNAKLTSDEAFTSKYLHDISYGANYTFAEEVELNDHTIAITTLDGWGSESAPTVMGQTAVRAQSPTPLYPSNNSTALLPALFRWSDIEGSVNYQIQIANDETFQDLVATRTTSDSTFNSALQSSIKNNTNYYWRVRTKTIGEVSAWSATYNFTSKLFGINSHQNGEILETMTPRIEWDNTGVGSTYTFRISTSNEFLSSKIVYETTTNDNYVVIPANKLISGTTYWAQVSTSNGNIKATSSTLTLYTKEAEIPVPVIISPENGTTLSGTTVTVKWQEQLSNGFRIEISESESFPPRGTKVKKTDGYTYQYEFTDLEDKTYYVRLKAQTAHEYTTYSEPVSFTINNTTPVDNITSTTFDEAYIVKSNNTLYIYTNLNSEEDIEITLYNTLGIELDNIFVKTETRGNNYTLNINNLRSGVYLIKINTKSNYKILKFQK